MNTSLYSVKRTLIYCIGIALLLTNCQSQESKKGMEGNITIFHAGSLSLPLHEIADSFNVLHPEVNINLEASGSLDAARKITDLNRKADIMASADYKVIEKLLIPDHTDWLIKFAANEMALVYDADSKFADQINQQNWHEIITKDNVLYGRSDPNSDPCGYRSVLTIQLAEKYYNKPGFAEKTLTKDKNFIRPKEIDLLALLESNTLDYIFLYRSVAQQHDLPYITLPDSINLGNSELKDHYAKKKVEISGKKPGEKITMKGEPMVYGITLINEAPHPMAAKAFLHFVLSKEKGLKIMEKNGQSSLIPAYSKTYEQIPEEFQKYAKRNKPE